MKIKVFGKENCGKCKSAKSKLKFFISKWGLNKVVKMEFLDMDTIDGMAEGAFYNVSGVPTTILEEDGVKLARWDEEVPKSEDVKQYFEIAKSEAQDKRFPS